MKLFNNLMASPVLPLKLNVKGEFILHAKTRQQGLFPMSSRDFASQDIQMVELHPELSS
jgi:hypothetical protein